MVNYVNQSVAEGLWVLGVVHYSGRYADGAIDYFMSELNIDLNRVGVFGRRICMVLCSVCNSVYKYRWGIWFGVVYIYNCTHNSANDPPSHVFSKTDCN